MLTCTFFRINDKVFNANCIKNLYFDDTKYDSIHGPIVRIWIFFDPSEDIRHMEFFTYYTCIGQILFDWAHQKNNFFEISYFELKDAIKMNHEKKIQDGDVDSL